MATFALFSDLTSKSGLDADKISSESKKRKVLGSIDGNTLGGTGSKEGTRKLKKGFSKVTSVLNIIDDDTEKDNIPIKPAGGRRILKKSGASVLPTIVLDNEGGSAKPGAETETVVSSEPQSTISKESGYPRDHPLHSNRTLSYFSSEAALHEEVPQQLDTQAKEFIQTMSQSMNLNVPAGCLVVGALSLDVNSSPSSSSSSSSPSSSSSFSSSKESFLKEFSGAWTSLIEEILSHESSIPIIEDKSTEVKEKQKAKKSVSFAATAVPPNDRVPGSSEIFMLHVRKIQMALTEVKRFISAGTETTRVHIQALACGLLSIERAPSLARSIMEACPGAQCTASLLQRMSGIVGPELFLLCSKDGPGAVRGELSRTLSWMACSVAKERLRWLLDVPPASISVPGAGGWRPPEGCRSIVHAKTTMHAPNANITPGALGNARVAATAPRREPLKLEEFPLSALFTQALRQYDDVKQLQTKVKDGDIEKWVAGELAHTDMKRQTCAALVLVAGESARRFLKQLLDLRVVSSEAESGRIWPMIREVATILESLGFPEDEHLLLLRDKTQFESGLTRPLAREVTIMQCRRTLASLDNALKRPRTLPAMLKSTLEDLKGMVREHGLIKDFPSITEY